jgi:nucleoside transporter
VTDPSQGTPKPLRARLAIQLFLQFGVIGAYIPVLGRHLELLHFTKPEIGYVYGTFALGTVMASLIAGEIADRWLAAEKYLAISMLATGVLLFFAARITADDPARFWKMWGLLFGAMLCYAPTPALATAMIFHHLRDPRGEFHVIRAVGTVGWIAAGLALGAWMDLGKKTISACLDLGVVFAGASALYSLTLPHTPPRRQAGSRAVVKAFAMLRDPSFALYTSLQFVLSVFAAFSYYRAAEFFALVGVKDARLSSVLSVGQVTEIGTMFLLPWMYGRFGAKGTIAFGMGSWVVRFLILSRGGPPGLMIAAQGMHGLCFTFAAVAGQIYVERICPPDIRASAQSLHSLVTGGLGMLVGAYVSGIALKGASAVSDWTNVWLVASAGSLAVFVVFVLAFRARDTAPTPAA